MLINTINQCSLIEQNFYCDGVINILISCKTMVNHGEALLMLVSLDDGMNTQVLYPRMFYWLIPGYIYIYAIICIDIYG